MKVEILYVSECPSHPAAVKLVKDVLSAEGVMTEIHEVVVLDEAMASELKFLGSPTIRINGRDVAGEAQTGKSFALSCRLYRRSEQVGVPAVELVQRAVVQARQQNQR